jgi:hypothetical protein
MVISEAEDSVISDVLDAVIARAEMLRTRGVRVVQVDGFRIELDPPEPAITPAMVAEAIASQEQTDEIDPLDDPATFGRKSGTPGFDISDTPDEI